MARKRNNGSDLSLSGAAPARQKSVTRTKHAHAPMAAEIAETAAPESVEAGPTFDDIARLAYSYWEARGYQGGSSEEDWLRAEQELLTRTFSAKA